MNKENLIDLVLRINFVNNSPAVGGAFVMAWVHGARFNPGVTFHEQLADLQESLGLPRELPKPEYPESIYAAFMRPEEPKSHKSKNKINNTTTFVTTTAESAEKNEFGDYEVFSGTVAEVHAWCQANEGKYSYMGHTNRTVITEQEAFDIWKAKILKDYLTDKT